MNMPIELHNVVSMTSLEIAELTGKRHAHVIRDIKKMQSELSEPKFGLAEISYTDDQGKPRPAYELDKRHTLILVTGYSVKLRASVIDRVEFLESQVKRLEDSKKRAAIQSANRRGVTWGDYCKTHDLPAQRLMKALCKAGALFKFRPDGRVDVHPNYTHCFTLIKPTDRRFSPTGLNFRFNAKGLEHFSKDKALDKFRTILIEQLGSDYEKTMLLVSQARAGNPNEL